MIRRDGSPASDVTVWLDSWRSQTDALGRVVFERVRPGLRRFEVFDPDFTWSAIPVELSDGEARSIVVVEPLGWTASARLLDSLGRPVPWADVAVTKGGPVPYARVENGIQDLAFHTDRNGDITLPRLHHVPVTLAFRYGSREATVTIAESDPSAIVRLPPP